MIGAMCSLAQCQLAESNSSGSFQFRNHRRVEIRNKVRENFCSGHGTNTLGIAKVLNSDWHSVEWAAVVS